RPFCKRTHIERASASLESTVLGHASIRGVRCGDEATSLRECAEVLDPTDAVELLRDRSVVRARRHVRGAFARRRTTPLAADSSVRSYDVLPTNAIESKVRGGARAPTAPRMRPFQVRRRSAVRPSPVSRGPATLRPHLAMGLPCRVIVEAEQDSFEIAFGQI